MRVFCTQFAQMILIGWEMGEVGESRKIIEHLHAPNLHYSLHRDGDRGYQHRNQVVQKSSGLTHSSGKNAPQRRQRTQSNLGLRGFLRKS